MGKNYYDILDVSKSATQQEIKKAFRKKALTTHPDKTGGDATKFKEINTVYSVLSDPEKRKQYDQYGEDFEKRGGGMPGGMPGGMNMSDIFEQMMPGMRSRRNVVKKCQDVRHVIKITLKEVYNGYTKKLKIHRTMICAFCEGFGTKDKTESKCSCNNGQRTITRQIGPGMLQQTTIQCPDCKGSGNLVKDSNNKCEMCSGETIIHDQNIVTVNIQKGVQNGKVIKFTGEANQRRGYESGDLVIQIQIDPSKTELDFRGNNLVFNKQINLAEALSEFSFIIEQLDGRNLYVKSNQIITPNQTLMIKGEGLPIHGSSSNGDLIIQFKIEFPKKVRHQEILSKIFEQPIENVKESDDYTKVTLENIGAQEKQKQRIVDSDSDEEDNTEGCRHQ